MKAHPLLSRALARVVPGLAALLLGMAAPVASLAQSCTGEPRPYIYVPGAIAGLDSGYSRNLVVGVSQMVADELKVRLAGGRAKVLSQLDFGSLLQSARLQMLMGADTVGNSVMLNEVLPASAVEWTLVIRLGRIGSQRRVNMLLVDMDSSSGHRLVRSRSVALPAGDGEIPAVLAAEVRALAVGLDCELRTLRGAPVQAQVRLAVDPRPPRGQTGGTLAVKATLVDLAANATPVPSQSISFHYLTPQGRTLSRAKRTGADGVATDTFVLGEAHPRAGLIEARFVDIRGYTRRSQQINYYVRPAGGQLNLSTGKAQLAPTGGDTVSAELRHNGNPVPAAAINISASAGAVGSASVITSSAGLAAVPYVAPNVPSLTDVRASATLPANAGTAQASVSYVVDTGVVMGFKGSGDTVIFGASSLRVDLEREQQAVAGASVEFRVAGGGTLSSAIVNTDSVGRAETVFAAPSRAGASTITASVALDGQTYTRSVTLRYRDPLDALTREIADVKEALWLTPSPATLTRLGTLRGALQARGEESRAETLLGDPLVKGQLFCVQQRAHDECAAGERTRAEATLVPLKGIARGSQVLGDLVTRVRDSLRICPYPAFASGSAFDPAATLNDIVYSHRLGLSFGISQWGDDDRPSGFGFDARDETAASRFVRGSVSVTGAGPSYSSTIDDGDMGGLWGNRMDMWRYQRAATGPTVSFSISGTHVSGSIQLYDGTYEDRYRVATLSFSTTVTLPAAPEATRCNHASLPSGD